MHATSVTLRKSAPANPFKLQRDAAAVRAYMRTLEGATRLRCVSC